MALTNFGTLTGDQLQMWSRDFWRVARNQSFINQFAGAGSNAMVQRITELTKNQKGTKANITLLADMTGDGITGGTTITALETGTGGIGTYTMSTTQAATKTNIIVSAAALTSKETDFIANGVNAKRRFDLSKRPLQE